MDPADLLDARVVEVPQDHYLHLVLDAEYPPETEAVIALACGLWRARTDVYVKYLRGSKKGHHGTPGRQIKSPAWREADAALMASVNAVAILIGFHFPSPGGQHPVPHALALIERRVGPLCTGWLSDDREFVYHVVGEDCLTHPLQEDQ
jgi:hypothetical protein